MNKDTMIKFDLPKNQSSIIKVLGVGGGGSNAVNHMFSQGIEGVDFIVCNTDSQALQKSPVPNKIQLGESLTEGRGAGSLPEVGKNAALEDIDRIKDVLEKNSKMIFITAGMGGGTGTGATPVIAEAAKELGILTVGIVTLPFAFEGRKRKMQADEGIKELKKNVDTLLIICNDKLRELYGNLSVSEAFAKADNVLTTASKGIAEIITRTGYINVDYADVRTVMINSGVAIMGNGTAEGENRSVKAIEEALISPLLNDNNINGASNILLNITSGKEEALMDEITEITEYIQTEAGSNAEIIWGLGKDENLGNKISVTLVATGFDTNTKFGYDFENEEKEKHVVSLESKKSSTSPKSQNVKQSSNEIKLVNKVEQQENKKTSEYADKPSKQKNMTIEFDLGSQKEAGENLNDKKAGTNEGNKKSSKPGEQTYSEDQLQQRVHEREKKLRELSLKLKTPEGLKDVENEPAFIRRNVVLNKVPSSAESQVSHYTLDVDQENKAKIKTKNSYLHDNVD